jgi:hypothetical protein
MAEFFVACSGKILQVERCAMQIDDRPLARDFDDRAIRKLQL